MGTRLSYGKWVRILSPQLRTGQDPVKHLEFLSSGARWDTVPTPQNLESKGVKTVHQSAGGPSQKANARATNITLINKPADICNVQEAQAADRGKIWIMDDVDRAFNNTTWKAVWNKLRRFPYGKKWAHFIHNLMVTRERKANRTGQNTPTSA